MTEMEIQVAMAEAVSLEDQALQASADLIQILRQRDAKIVELAGAGLTMRQIGRTMGISGARVAQITSRERGR